MSIVTTTNLTGGTVSLRIDNPEMVTYLQKLAAKGDLVSVDVTDEPGDVKVTKVADVKAEVGNDPEKALAALEAEQASDKPRSSLVDHLAAVIEAARA